LGVGNFVLVVVGGWGRGLSAFVHDGRRWAFTVDFHFGCAKAGKVNTQLYPPSRITTRGA
jgi:hypothetical protein